MRNRTFSLSNTHVEGRRSPLMKSLRTLLIVANLIAIVSIIAGCALLDGSLWAPTTPQLKYSEDLSAWGANYYFAPHRIDLTETPPEAGWIEPEPRGRLRLYGIIPFVHRNDVRVIVDELDDVEAVAAFAFSDDKDFRNSPLYEIHNGDLPEKISFPLFYPDGTREQYAICIYYIPEYFGSSAGSYPLHYYRGNVRGGLVDIDGKEVLLAIEDEDTDGVYSDLRSTGLLIDLDGDGTIQHEKEHVGAAASFQLEGTSYIVDHIAEAGTSISFRLADKGTITGYVHSNHYPIRDATIVLDGKFETKTDANGRFNLKVPEGDYGALLVKAPGYVPLWKTMWEKVNLEQDIVVTVELKPATSLKQGYIILNDGDSYHFLAGEMHYGYVGGDFIYTSGHFMANYPHQRGVADLGIVNDALCTVEAPSSGYTRYAVEAIVGHTYVSLAKEGEEGHYIAFKVITLTEDSVSLGYCYR